VSGRRIVALVLWTAAFAFFCLLFLLFSIFGDCVPGEALARCAEVQGGQWRYQLWIEFGVYLALTWLFFFSRWKA
jgi:hypothetical protein